ncbi:hypothetical protein JHK87_039301 [Glycine soja]|nr:hypothetical protein JHK87_039301 [Glycine soja]
MSVFQSSGLAQDVLIMCTVTVTSFATFSQNRRLLKNKLLSQHSLFKGQLFSFPVGEDEETCEIICTWVWWTYRGDYIGDYID